MMYNNDILVVGQAVWSYGRLGIISAIYGMQEPTAARAGVQWHPNNRATFDILFEDHIVKVAEPRLRRGEEFTVVSLLDIPPCPSAAIQAKAEAIMVKQRTAKAKADAEIELKLAAQAKLAADNPHLTVLSNSISRYACAAKNIRVELKRAWPTVWFSVRSSSFSDGCSISIAWTDGPSVAMVQKITSKYEDGTFDCMTDMYNYARKPWGDVFGSAKYIIESRTATPDLARAVALKLGFKEPLTVMDGYRTDFQELDRDTNLYILRNIQEHSFINGKLETEVR